MNGGNASGMRLAELDDDTLIHIFSFLPVHTILVMRQTCRGMYEFSNTRVVWRNAYSLDVLEAGFPFPHRKLVGMHAAELEHAVRRAIRIGRFWRTLSTRPRRTVDFPASSGTGVSEVRFLPGHDGRRIATLSKGIWSVIACWDVAADGKSEDARRATKVAEWCPSSTIVTGLVVNSEEGSEGLIATSVSGGRDCIEVLSLVQEADGSCAFRSLGKIHTTMRPIALRGDLLAYSDDSSRTVITNWKTGALALLQGADEPVNPHFQYNRCLQVVFTHKSILVVRARSIELFPEPMLQRPESCPTYHSLAYHSFGWVDGVSVNVQMRKPEASDPSTNYLSILLRAESDDPWMSDVHTLDLYVFEPNPSFADKGGIPVPVGAAEETRDIPTNVLSERTKRPPPYLFPPVHSSLSSPSVRGFLRCTDIVLGPYGTAIWIQPRPARNADLTTLDVHASETQGPRVGQEAEVLAGAVFAGQLREGCVEGGEWRCGVQSWTVFVREAARGGNWTAMDYVEELGMVALASTQGLVTVLELG